MSFTLKSSECLELTRELAEKHAKMYASPTEREVDSKRVQFLAEKIDKDLFINPCWAIAIIDGKPTRMNGQHSSIALCESDGNFPNGLKVHLDTYTCDDVEDSVMLFRQFDNRRSGRTSVDTAGAYMGVYPDLKKINPKIGKIAISGANDFRRKEGEQHYSGDEIGRQCSFPEVRQFILWFSSLSIIGKSSELHPVMVVSAMMGTVRANQSAATDFWNQTMKRSQQFDETHPATVLENYLCLLRNKDERPKKMPKAGHIHEAARLCWNAFRAEKPTNIKALLRINADSSRGFSTISE